MLRSTLLISFAVLCCTCLSAKAEMIEFKVRKEASPLKFDNDNDSFLLSERISIPDKLDVPIGHGFDYLTGEILPEPCVLADSSQPDVNTPQDSAKVLLGDKREYLNSVSGMEANESVSGQGGGFSFAYKLVHIGGETENTKENYFNSVDGFAKIYVRFLTRSVERVGGVWGANAGPAAADKDKRRFVEICGTHYVRAVYYGSVINQTFKFTLKSAADMKAQKSNLTAGIGDIFGAHFDSVDRETAIRNVAQITFVDESRGLIAKRTPDPTKPSATPPQGAPATSPAAAGTAPSAATNPVQAVGGLQAAINYAHNQFPIDVAASQPNESQVLYVDVEPYYRLGVSGASFVPRLSNEMTTRLSGKSGLYERLLTQISDIRYAQKMPDEAYKTFYSTPKEKIPDLISAATDLQISYSKAIDKCIDLIRSYADKDPENACSSALDDVLSPKTLARVAIETK